ncbi:MAG TPA: hypothetical protein PLB32_23305, partial [Acidobacteriota bacterium]|nr:hypothetical protein [Acidobacteriota bacterium]
DVFAEGEEVPSVDDDAVLKSGVEPPHSTGVKPPNTKAASSRRTPHPVPHLFDIRSVSGQVEYAV